MSSSSSAAAAAGNGGGRGGERKGREKGKGKRRTLEDYGKAQPALVVGVDNGEKHVGIAVVAKEACGRIQIREVGTYDLSDFLSPDDCGLLAQKRLGRLGTGVGAGRLYDQIVKPALAHALESSAATEAVLASESLPQSFSSQAAFNLALRVLARRDFERNDYSRSWA